MNMEQAVRALRDNYQRALKNHTIDNPMAWAFTPAYNEWSFKNADGEWTYEIKTIKELEARI